MADPVAASGSHVDINLMTADSQRELGSLVLTKVGNGLSPYIKAIEVDCTTALALHHDRRPSVNIDISP